MLSCQFKIAFNYRMMLLLSFLLTRDQLSQDHEENGLSSQKFEEKVGDIDPGEMTMVLQRFALISKNTTNWTRLTTFWTIFSRHVLLMFILTYLLHFGLCEPAPLLLRALKGVSAKWKTGADQNLQKVSINRSFMSALSTFGWSHKGFCKPKKRSKPFWYCDVTLLMIFL